MRKFAANPDRRRVITRLWAASVLTLTVLLLSSLVLVPQTVEAQPVGPELDAWVMAAAQGVVNGEVVSSTTLEIGETPYTIQEVNVESTLVGQIPETIRIAIPGGVRSDGSVVQLSHAPKPLDVGASVQIGLEAPPPDLLESVIASTSDDSAVYSVVGGREGIAVRLASGVFVEAAASDFVFNQAARPGWSPPQTYRVNASNSGISTTAALAAVRAGFDRWENDPLSSIDFSYTGQWSGSGIRIPNGVTDVSWESPNANNAMSNSTLAIAHFVAGSIHEFDIVINRDKLWAIGQINGRFDIETVISHEVGHGIGLAHTPANSELMFASFRSGQVKELGSGDLTGARQLYPNPNAGAIVAPGHSVASNESGQTVATSIRADGRLQFRRDNGSGYGAWQTLAVADWTSADVTIRPNGEAHLVGVKGDGRLFTLSQTSSGVWSAWTLHGSDFEPTAAPSIAANASRVVVAAVSSGGGLRTAERGGSWSSFTSHGFATWSQVDVDIAANGDIWFAGTKSDGRLFVRKKINGVWSGFSPQGLPTWDADEAPAVAAYSNGVVVAALKQDGRLYTRHQIGGSWRNFVQQGLPGWSGVDVAISANGTAWFAGVKADGRVYTRNAFASATWRSWTIHGLATWAPTAAPGITIGGSITQPTLVGVKASGQLWVRERSSAGWGFWQNAGTSWAVGQ